MHARETAPTEGPERHLLSIDVDDLATANADFFGDPLPPGHAAEIERELAGTLDLLGRCGLRATFFVNGQYCERYPDLPKEIAQRGHQLASHGHRHWNVARLTLEAFEQDLCRSLERLAPVQPRILGYRPPAFSMPYDAPHLAVLARHGIRYVSSGVGVSRSNAPTSNLPVEVAHGLLHVPISTVHLLGGRLKYPIGYGVVARLMPEPLYLLSLRRWLRRHSYLHLYLHAFEVGGLAIGFKVPHRRLPARITTGIYSLRCRGRGAFLEKVLTSARFGSIEERLFPAGAAASGSHAPDVGAPATASTRRTETPPILTRTYATFDHRHFELFTRTWSRYVARGEGKRLSEAQMRQLYEGNPAGPSLLSVAEEEGDWIGAISALPMHVALPGGERRLVYQLGDLVVDPGHQGRGLGRRLSQELTAALRRLGEPVFGFPNRRSVGIFRKERFLEPRVLPTLVYPARAAAARLWLRRGERPHVRDVSLDEACRLADDVAAQHRARPRIEKSGAYLRWRYAQTRNAGDYHFTVVEQRVGSTTALVIWTIFRYRGIRFQVVLDSVVADESPPALAAVAAQAAGQGAELALCHLERAPGWRPPPLAVRVPARLDPRPAVLIVPPDDAGSLQLFSECLFTTGDWLGF